MKNKKEQDSDQLGKAIIECIKEKKGLNIVNINLTNTDNSVCDFFIIAHADSDTQVRAIGKHIEESIRESLPE